MAQQSAMEVEGGLFVRGEQTVRFHWARAEER